MTESRCEVFRAISLEKTPSALFRFLHIQMLPFLSKTCEHEQYTYDNFFFLNTMHTSWKCQTKSKVTGVDPSGRNSSCMFNLSFRISFYSWNKLVRYIIHTFLVELLSHTVTDNESIPTKDHSPLECQCVWWWCQICKYELILSLLCSHDRDCIGYSFLCISI
jgi:hypothetical protein